MEETIAKNIRVLRAIRGISRADLSRNAKDKGFSISPGTITRIELLQKQITIADLEAISGAFGVPVQLLLIANIGGY